MKLKDYEKLRKCMELTFSTNDNEALASMRAANALLTRYSLTWERVFARVVSVVNEFEAAPEDTDEKRMVDEAFATVEASDPRGSFADFIASLKDQWDKNGHLSIAQKDSLFKAARRVK